MIPKVWKKEVQEFLCLSDYGYVQLHAEQNIPEENYIIIDGEINEGIRSS